MEEISGPANFLREENLTRQCPVPVMYLGGKGVVNLRCDRATAGINSFLTATFYVLGSGKWP